MHYPDLERQLVALASLADPVRQALYRCVAARDEGMGRDEAAAAVGISRALAAYHLDKLAEAGLLDTRFQRRTGRAGPGAGRPAKFYLRSRSPVEVALPARNYQLIADLLAQAEMPLRARGAGPPRSGLPGQPRFRGRARPGARGQEPAGSARPAPRPLLHRPFLVRLGSDLVHQVAKMRAWPPEPSS
jgi:DNA-binding transcriptional ArsR family regulator